LPVPHQHSFWWSSSPIRLSLQLHLVTSIHHENKLHHPCPVDTEPHHSQHSQHSGRLGSQAGLHSFPVLHSNRPGFGEGSDPEDRATGVLYPLPSQSTLSHTPHPYRRGQTQFHWRLGWSRSECITVAQLRTGHSPLLASYLHRIGRQLSPLGPHCGGDDETAQHLLLCCPAHMQAHTSTNYTDSTDPRRMMSFLEMIGASPDRE